MSLASKDFSTTAKAWGIALASTIFMAANANAADPTKFIQVTDVTSNGSVPSNACVRDDAQGKAFDKIEAIKKSRGQLTVIEADRVAKADRSGNAYGGISFTSNFQASEKKGLLGEGFVITSNAPKGKVGTQYCFNIVNDYTGLASVINGKKVPNLVNIGTMGQGLTTAMNTAESKVGYSAVTNQHTLLAVNFNFNTKQGSYGTADGSGNNYLPMGLENVEYSPEIPLAYQKALGIPAERIALNTSVNAATPR